MKFARFITDCADPNATLRLGLRGQILFGTPPQIAHVRTEIEAAGLLIDALDVASGNEGVIFVNVAPRNGDVQRKHHNGVPFGYFLVGRTLVVSTIGPETLSLGARLGIIKTVHIFDIPTVVTWAVASSLLSQSEADDLIVTQFRSLRFAPLVGKWLSETRDVPSEPVSIDTIVNSSCKCRVWFVDCFGNCKTTQFVCGHEVPERLAGNFKFYPRLKDVPDDGQPAWIIGSSGYDNNRFLELVVQGRSAAEVLQLRPGSLIPDAG